MFYADDGISFLNLRFENDVKMYGTQADLSGARKHTKFENDVKCMVLKQSYDAAELICRSRMM